MPTGEYISLYKCSYLWPGIPKPHDWIDATGCQEAVAWVRLQAVHNRLIPLQHSHKVGSVFLPDEEGAIIRATDDVLRIARVENTDAQRAEQR